MTNSTSEGMDTRLNGRVFCSELDAILGVKFPVLDDGFIRVIDYMGGDSSIVQAARVSYGAGTKRPSDDEHLIRYLMRHRHTTPFEMCELKLHVRVPMDVWRQWIRHRTASVNEYSTRYSLAIDAARKLAPDEWRAQSSTNRQGSGEPIDAEIGTLLSKEEAEFQHRARELYQSRIDRGISREIARKDLPLSTYTEAYWKCDLKNLLNFIALRITGAAQYEIRAYAEVIGREIVAKWVPFTWKAFEDYELSAKTLTAPDQELLKTMFADRSQALDAALRLGYARKEPDGSIKVMREGTEFAQKIKPIGLTPPW